MIKYFLERINRQVSRLWLCYQMRVVSVDQITFVDEVYTLGHEFVKTPKNG